jgi:hypothetical protein
MFQPRRLQTCRPSSVETRARKPSHLTSKAHPSRKGRPPERKSAGTGKPTEAAAGLTARRTILAAGGLRDPGVFRARGAAGGLKAANRPPQANPCDL